MVKATRGKTIILYGTVIIMLVCALFPIYWMLNTSLKPQGEVYSQIPTFWPKTFTWKSYENLIFEKNFLINIKNSLFVSLVTTVISITISVMAAYAITKLNFKGKNLLTRGILYAYLMPTAILFIPLYILVSSLGLNNSLYGLVLIYPTITIPYATWMLISYFKTIPVEIEEAAMIDGCSRIGTMFKIIFPLSTPGIAATSVFCFTLCWCEYLYALIIVTKTAAKPITLSLADMVVSDSFAWGPLMGGSIIASIPVTIIYLLSSKLMVTGMTSGGVK